MSIVPYPTAAVGGLTGAMLLYAVFVFLASPWLTTLPEATYDAWIRLARIVAGILLGLIAVALTFVFLRRIQQDNLVDYAAVSGQVETDWSGRVPPRAKVFYEAYHRDRRKARREAKIRIARRAARAEHKQARRLALAVRWNAFKSWLVRALSRSSSSGVGPT